MLRFHHHLKANQEFQERPISILETLCGTPLEN